ncbi:MAG: DUF2169 domain-containing protein [Marinospirillum sp.]|uniref:DUF2169 family type VI secretion system accessory protein n=1 Tax=Marinospirillum sp. TaxID=2183934 RepID=UPI001A088482|nr:DUF2169 domain-containing protein [Marinospirillum sp.]MBE0506336.1 DUF2169 domain-containing protein [Marinospirillum sp.]
MQNIKPLQLTPVNRSFTYQHQHYYSLGALLGFDLSTGKTLLEQELWEKVSETPEIQILDAGFPKPQAEFLVYGCAETPEGKPATELSVSIQVGDLKKQLRVLGEGYWRGLPCFKQQQVDTPFTRVPLSRDYAFGGEGYVDNPEGKGYQAITTAEGDSLYPITQLQLLNTPAQNPGQVLPLAYTSAMDLMATQRQQFAGTYDDAYMQKAMPGLPDDFDWLFCQDALPDQRFKSPTLPSGAPYLLQNLNAEFPLIKGQLPHWQAVAWLLQQHKDQATPVPQQVRLKAETLILLPNQNLGIIVYRGQIQVCRDDARDIKALMLALEDPAAPKPEAHYIDQLYKRSDQENAWRYLLDTQPLLPAQITCGMALLLEQESDMPAMDMPQMGKVKYQIEEIQAQAMQQVEAERLNLQQQGLDLPSTPATPPPPEWQAKMEALQAKILPKKANGSPDLAKIDFDAMKEITPLVEEIKNQEMVRIQQEILPQLEALLLIPELKDRYPEIRNKIALLKNPPPPNWPRVEIEESLDQSIAQLEKEILEIKNIDLLQLHAPEKARELEQQLHDSIKKIEEAKVQLADTPAKIKAAYRMGAEQPERGSPLLDAEQRLLLRQQVLDAISRKQPLPTDDLSDLDLSNQNLDGVDFSECYMEGINLSGSSLKGAKLTGVIMVYANLQQSDFSGADLSGANIGASRIEQTRFHRTIMTETNLNKAQILSSDFTGAQLDKTQWMQASLQACNFTETSMKQLNLIDPIFTDCNFTAADLSQCNLVNPVFTGCRFDRFKAQGSNLVKMQATGSSFVAAQLNNARFVGGCQLDDSNFSKAQMNMASLREASVKNSHFDGAQMEQADLELANLTSSSLKKANLYRANLANTNFTAATLEDANLMESVLYHACVVNTDLRGANLYAANLLYMEHGNTRFDFANLDRTLLQDWHP